jgi:hypothetical protein
MATITLYRADASDLYDGVGSCWSESQDDAKAYTDNQGFGGDTIHSVEMAIDSDRVLDLTGERAVAELAKVLDLDKQDLMDMGGQVWHCWENSARIKDRLAADYDWVKYTDDFPVNCTTWCRFAE